MAERTANLQARLTPEAKHGLQVIAQSLNISLSELLERQGRHGAEFDLLGES